MASFLVEALPTVGTVVRPKVCGDALLEIGNLVLAGVVEHEVNLAGVGEAHDAAIEIADFHEARRLGTPGGAFGAEPFESLGVDGMAEAGGVGHGGVAGLNADGFGEQVMLVESVTVDGGPSGVGEDAAEIQRILRKQKSFYQNKGRYSKPAHRRDIQRLLDRASDVLGPQLQP